MTEKEREEKWMDSNTYEITKCKVLCVVLQNTLENVAVKEPAQGLKKLQQMTKYREIPIIFTKRKTK